MKKAGDVLEALFRDRFGPGFADKARSTAGLFSAWTEITSEAWPPRGEREKGDISPAASHSRIREFEKGMLLVEADHPGMVQLLQIKQEALLSASRRRFPELEIRCISFCLSRDPFSFSRAGAVSAAAPPQTAVPHAVDSAADVKPRKTVKRAGKENDSYYAALKKLGDSVKMKKN